jgi:putative nucleotidyltransferase with HDIG domain
VQKIYEQEAFKLHMEQNKAAEATRIFCKHDLQHCIDVARIATILNLQEGFGVSKELIYATALLHDIGRHLQYENGTPHEEASAKLAPDILAACGFAEEEIGRIVEAIARHRDVTAQTESNLVGLLYRADKASRACYQCVASEACNWSEDKKNKKILL